MAKITVRYKRAWAALDDVARARLCECSGSESSESENMASLSDLVDLFLERDDEGGCENEEKKKEEERVLSDDESNSESYWSEPEAKVMLQSLIGDDRPSENDDVKQTLRVETELACRVLGNSSSEGFKGRLMSWLRQRGFDAGLCKSRWEKSARYPAGEYEFMDIVVAGTRYIVEVSLSGEFTIARQTRSYLSLLEVFPQVAVFKQGELKQVVRLMCAAMKKSMKKRGMHVPPWRSNGYMQAKWFSTSKRTTGICPASKASDSGYCLAGKRLVGFETSPPVVCCHCRGEFTSKAGLQICM